MSWASHPTTEMPTNPLPPSGRHRAGRRGLIGVAAAVAVVLVLAGVAFVSGLLNAAPAGGPALADRVPTGSFSTRPEPAGGIAGDPGTPTTSVGTTPAPTPTAIPPGNVSVAASAGLEAEVFALTNTERAKQGCAVLRLDDSLAAAARAHSVEMAGTGTFQHDSLDGTDPGQRMRAAGYDTSGTGWAENIARGQSSPTAVMAAWMGSPGHRANILNCGQKAIGVGVARAANGQLYWTQDFGGR